MEALTISKHGKGNQTVQLAGLGLEMGLAMAIGFFGGRYLDGWLQTEPIFKFVGIALGIGAGAKALLDATRKVRKEWDQDGSAPDED